MMNEIKLVSGSVRNRKIMTATKQRELALKNWEQEQTRSLTKEWFEVDENEPLTKSDIAMSVGVYICVPVMVVATAIGAILV